MKKYTQKGFTLIELLVVISIIGILSSVVLTSLSSARNKAFEAKKKAELNQIATSLESYYIEHGYYPYCPHTEGCCLGTGCILADDSIENSLDVAINNTDKQSFFSWIKTAFAETIYGADYSNDPTETIDGFDYRGHVYINGTNCDSTNGCPIEDAEVVSVTGRNRLESALVKANFQLSFQAYTQSTTDTDGDGYGSNNDCNDNNASIHPGAADNTLDGVDNDCDGSIDEEYVTTTDNDADGYYAEVNDCNDNNSSINPAATDIPDNGIDEDCNGSDSTTNTDNDSDGYYAEVNDCNDGDSGIHPNQSDGDNDGVDDDCDGSVDEDYVPPTDNDMDGYWSNGGDCNDNASNINPAAYDYPDNGIDEDCNGSDSVTSYDNDTDGYSTTGGDCNDNDSSINPGAGDNNNNGIDNDCDGSVDEDYVDPNSTDDDSDGYSENGGDCNDSDSNTYPGNGC